MLNASPQHVNGLPTSPSLYASTINCISQMYENHSFSGITERTHHLHGHVRPSNAYKRPSENGRDGQGGPKPSPLQTVESSLQMGRVEKPEEARDPVRIPGREEGCCDSRQIGENGDCAGENERDGHREEA